MERYKAYLNKTRWLCRYNNRNNHVGVFDLFLSFNSNCHNTATWTTNVLRACGIPTVYEYTPQWQDRCKPHFWCATVDSMGVARPYTPPENIMMEDWESDLKYAGKVYRRTFGANENTPYFLHEERENIPNELSSPLLSDQTYRYHQTVTLSMPFDEKTGNKLAYLCFFSKNEVGLVPVAWGMIDKKRNEVVFDQVPLNVLFFPACYQGDELVPFAAPFILRAKSCIDWLPEAHTQSIFEKPIKHLVKMKNGELFKGYNNKRIEDIQFVTFVVGAKEESMIVLRKYPDKRRLEARRKKLVGSIVYGSQHLEGPYDTLCRLKEVPNPYLQEVTFSNIKRYRYYFFAGANGGATNMACLEFLGMHSATHRCVSPTPLPRFLPALAKDKSSFLHIIGTPLNTGNSSERAFDGNVETYSGSSIIGVDFESPVCIEAIRFTPRNGNNMITVGDKYALYYYDMGWQYFVTHEAKDNFMSFTKVPSGTIYWLVNLTRGQEELPFYYGNGKQSFINLE